MKDMDQKEYMTEVLAYIEQHLKQPFHVQELPVSRYLSTMQLYRDFYNLTGHSVKEYIRKRRLSSALNMVKHSDRSLAEIAYEYGYSSQQAFCKCVKAATGLTPLGYKLNESYYYFPRFCFEAKYQVTVTTEYIPKTIHMKFYHEQLRGIENRSIRSLFSVIPDYKGRIFGRNGKQQNHKFCYELNVEYKEEMKESLTNSIFKEVCICEAYKDMFAKIKVKNVEQFINLAWDYLYLDWLKVSMFEQSHRSYFEEYICNKDNIKRLILYLPVIRREASHKIWMKECESMNFLVSSFDGSDREEKASMAVLSYLEEHNPYLIDKVSKFYVSAKNGCTTCGISIHKNITIKKGSPVSLLHIKGGSFVVLEGACSGDSNVYNQILDAWMLDNGLNNNGNGRFTIFETDGSYAQNTIKTFVYQSLD